MTNPYQIRRMSQKEVGIAVQWAEKEGWNPGLDDAAAFYQTDPNGFFIGYLNEQPIAVGSAVCYDEHFAFCGFYIVEPEFRHQGYGLALTKARLAYVGNRNAGIDGVTEMLNKYERLGYRIAHQNARYQMTGRFNDSNSPHKAISPFQDSQFDILKRYDRAHFPAHRSTFLTAWLHQPHAKALTYSQDGEIQGYGVIRACVEGYKIGPLFADNEAIADALFVALIHEVTDGPIVLDIPENNPHAIALVQRYEMAKVFETARMYLKGKPDLKDKQIFGITSFELG